MSLKTSSEFIVKLYDHKKSTVILFLKYLSHSKFSNIDKHELTIILTICFFFISKQTIKVIHLFYITLIKIAQKNKELNL